MTTQLSKLNSVLVVDDSRVARRLVMQALITGGIPAEALSEAKDGAEALELVEANMPDLVLSDVNMPRLDGGGLLDELNKRGLLATLPVVMITSTATARNKLALRRRGARAVLSKPFAPEMLFEQICGVLAESSKDPDAAGDAHDPSAQEAPDAAPSAEAEAAADAEEQQLAEEEAITGDPLRDAVARCLERMAFFDVEHEAVEANPDQVTYVAVIPFPHDGSALEIGCQAALASELHERLTNDTSPTDRSLCEAVSELCNVVAGDWVLFARLKGEAAKFGLPSWHILVPGDAMLDATTFLLDGAEPLFARVTKSEKKTS